MANHTAPVPASPPSSPTPIFNRERHIKYHLRCLKTLLPNAYTGNDASRMMLAFFTLASLDLLDALDSHISAQERADFVQWIYSCQLSDGGFRAFPGTDFGQDKRTADNEAWDPAHIAGTIFALLNLLILRDDLGRVKRRETLHWLGRLQVADGSFAEQLGEEGTPVGGGDMRFAYMASCVRDILRGDGDGDVQDIDQEGLIRFVLSSQSYDGGFAKQPLHESHAGHFLCAISILRLLGAIEEDGRPSPRSPVQQASLDAGLKWLVSRQTPAPAEEEESDDEDTTTQKPGFQVLGAIPAKEFELAGPLVVDVQSLRVAGFNGRCNKPADTCYSFWVVGSLDVLGKATLIDFDANRRYLLDRTQHVIGGFAKVPGHPPDVLHSYFGLAALSLMGDEGFEPLATELSISRSAYERIQTLPWKKD